MKLTVRQVVKHLLLFLILSYSKTLAAQQSLTTINGWNAYVHLPDDYTSTTQKYPTIVFIAGIGEVGSNPALMLNYGPSYFIEQGHNMQFTVNGVLLKPIVISMQPPSAWPIPSALNRQLDSICSRWRVDTNRLSLTGLSMGGWSWDNYVTNNFSYSKRPAAMVVMSAPPPASIPNFSWYAANGGKWWGFEGTQDYRQMDLIRDVMNNTVAGSAKYTSYVGGHCCWNTWYNPAWTENGESIYTWMLKQSRSSSANNIVPVANAGTDQVINFPSITATLSGSGTDVDGSITAYSWTKISGPLSFNILNSNAATTTVTSLLPGTYQFQLTVTDDSSATDSDIVSITVNSILSNQSPVANAGNNQSITLPTNSVSLNGSSSTDPDGTISTYNWSRISGPGQYNIVSPSSANTTVNNLVAGTYRFRLQVTDNDGANHSDTVTVTVNSSGSGSCGCSKTIQPGVDGGAYINGNTLGVQPGDRVCVLAGNYKYINMFNFNGTAANPIEIINCGGAVVISGPTYGITMTNSTHFRLTGTGASGITYGFRVRGDTAMMTTGIGISTRSSDFEVDHIEIYKTAVGVICKTNPTCDSLTWEPAFTMRNISFHDIYMRNIEGEGFYVGHTSPNVTLTCNGSPITVKPQKIRGLKIYNCITDSTGWDGIQVASAPENCEVYNNSVRNYGTRNFSSQQAGILFGGICNGKAYNNYVEQGSGVGLAILGVGYIQAYNNVIVNAGYDGSSVGQDGIFIDDRPQVGYPNLYVNISSNTIVAPRRSGIRLENTNHSITSINLFHNNLIADPGSNSGAAAYIDVRNGALHLSTGNINQATIPGAGFVSPSTFDFHLLPSSPAVNAGISLVPLNILTDKDGLSRPIGLFYDAGAYEYNVGAPPPNIPPTANADTDKTITLPTNTVILNGSATDPDGTIASYNWSKIAGPSQFIIASPSTATTTINNLVQGTYQFRLVATDDDGAADADTVIVTVNAAAPPPNQAPVANAGANQTITLPSNSVVLNGSGTDSDGSVIGYAWTRIAGPAQYNIVNASSAQTSVTSLVQGVYQFRLQVTDDDAATGSDTVTITVNAAPPPPNQSPVANAGIDLSITLPTNTVTLNGSGADNDGSISSYNWTKIGGPLTFNIANPSQAQTQVNNLVQGIYLFRLLVTDNIGATAADTVVVTVNAAPPPPPPNQPPVSNAGVDQTITLPTSSVILYGSGIDADGSVTSYGWTKISGPAQFNILNPASASTVVNNLAEGTYLFRMVVTDNNGASDDDTVAIIVNPSVAPPPPNQVPVVNAGYDQSITLPTNTVTLNGLALDPDGSIASYSWTKISGPAQFNILSAASAQTVVNNLVQGVYQFQLQVTDNNGATASDIVLITVNAAPPPPTNQPPMVNAGNDQAITLPSNTVTLNGLALDPDGSISSYSWTRISGPTTYTIVNPSASQTQVTGLVQGVYQFQLTTTDNGGATGSDVMTVTVNAAPPPSNLAPIVNAGVDQTITLPMNSVVLSGLAVDADGTIAGYAWIWISGPAQYSIQTPNASQTAINNLVQGVYQFQLQATDNNGATATDVVTVTVNAAPPPPSNLSPIANAGNDQTITLPVSSVTLNGLALDPDGTIAGYSWSKISGPAQYTIVNPSSSQTAVNGLTEGVYQFQLTVSDNNGATGTDIMTVTVLAAAPPTNQAPIANAGSDQSITLPTNTVTLHGLAIDPDGTIAGYSWTKIAGPAQFNITDPASSQSTVTNLVQGVYQFQLTATDNGGATDTDIVTITVNSAANTAPVANAGNDHNIMLPINSVVLSGNGTDADGTISGYSWTNISGPSQYTIISPNQAQTIVSDLVQGVYVFVLSVSDNDGASDTDTVVVTVNAAANRMPHAYAGDDKVIILPNNTVTLEGNGVDPDGTIVGFRWRPLDIASQLNLVAPTSPQATVSNLVSGTYSFELEVTDNSGAKATDTLNVIVKDLPSSRAYVFPNPARNIINIGIEANTATNHCQLTIYDLSGKPVHQEMFMRTQTMMTKQLNITHLLPGAYIIEIGVDINRKVSLKLVKQ